MTTQAANLPVLGAAACALTANQVHVVGLAGTGLRGLVPLLQARGARVTGSDMDESPVLETLRGQGVVCSVGHSDSNVEPGTDLVLISAAVKMDNPEVRAAVQKHIAILKYSQCLGYLMAEKQGIAVAGTHGKTTTTAMVSFVLLDSGMDPSFVLGGDHPSLGGGSRSGAGPHFVAEACEYDRSFLNLRPRAAVVTNIEEEHLDYFRSLREIQQAFREFAGLLPADGCLVFNRDDANSRFLLEATDARTEGFSLEPGRAAWWAENVRRHGQGSTFLLRGPQGRRAQVRLKVPGLHNVRNALACAALCSWAGVPVERTARALGRYKGVRRRFDVLLRKPVTVVDDYAHHPTEVRSVIAAARQAYPRQRIVCVFQPHQYSRLRIMLESFAEALNAADEVLVTQVFRCRDRDEDVRAVDSAVLVSEARSRGGSCHDTPTFDDVRTCLDSVAPPGTVVIFMGAGTISEMAKEYAMEVRQRSDPGRLSALRVTPSRRRSCS